MAGGALTDGIPWVAGQKNYSLNNNFTLADGTTSTIMVYGSSTLTLNGTITGTGSLTKADGGTLVLSNNVSMKNLQYAGVGGVLSLHGANNTFTSTVTVQGTSALLNFGANDGSVTTHSTVQGLLSVGTGSVNFYDGSTSDLNALRASDGGFDKVSVINQFEGSIVNITGNNNANNTSHSFLLAHWRGTSTYNLSGGLLNSLEASLGLAWAGNGTFNQSGGVVNTLGIMASVGDAGNGTYNLSGGTLNLGSGGIYSNNATLAFINLGAGTLGTYANWSSSLDMKLGYFAGSQVAGTTDSPIKTIINTTDSVDSANGGHTITLNGVLSNVDGSVGGLKVTGTGSLVLNGANTFTGGVELNSGNLVVNNNSALGAEGNRHLTISGSGSSKDNSPTITFGAGVTGALTSLTFNSNSTLNWVGNPVAQQSFENLNIAGNNTIYMSISSGASDQLTATNVNISGSFTWDVFATGLKVGDEVVLLNYTNLTGDSNDFHLNLSSSSDARAIEGQLVNKDNSLVIQITGGGAADLTWTSSTGTWQTGSPENQWDTTATDKHFFTGDNVAFIQIDGSTNETVNIVGDVQPGAILVNGGTTEYTFSGTGSIIGSSTNLIVESGVLNIDNVNTFGGLTSIAEGATINLHNNGALTNSTITGTGSLNVNWTQGEEGTLSFNNFTGNLALTSGTAAVSVAHLNTLGNIDFAGGVLKLNSSGQITHAISGTETQKAMLDFTGQNITFDAGSKLSGYVNIKGGSVGFGNDTSFTGNLTVDGGSFNLKTNGASDSLGTGILTLINGGTLVADWDGNSGNTTAATSKIIMGNSARYDNVAKGNSQGWHNFELATGDEWAYFNGNSNVGTTYQNGTISGVGNVQYGYNAAQSHSGMTWKDGWTSNSYVGMTAVEAGTTNLTYSITTAPTSNEWTPFGAYDANVANSATLQLLGAGAATFNSTLTGDAAITNATLKGGFIFGNGSALTFSSLNDLTVTGALNIATGNTATINVNATNLILNGAMTGAALTGVGTINVNSTGNGSLILMGNSSEFTGTLSSGDNANIQLGYNGTFGFTWTGAGTLSVGENISATMTGLINGSGTLSLAQGSTLHYTGNSTAGNIRNITGPGTLDLTGGGSIHTDSYHTNPVTISGGTTVICDSFNYGEGANFGTMGNNAPYMVLNDAKLVMTGTQRSLRKFTVGAGGATIEVAEGGNFTEVLATDTWDRLQVNADNAVLTLSGAGVGIMETTAGNDIFYSATASNMQTFSIVKDGTGSWTMTGTNTYGGGTTINDGTLIINTVGALGTGAVTINGGTFDMGGLAFAQTISMTSGNLSNAGQFASTVSINQTGKTATTMNMGGLDASKITEFVSTKTDDKVTTLSGLTGTYTVGNNVVLSFDSSMVGTTPNNTALFGGADVNITNGANITLDFTNTAATKLVDGMTGATSKQYITLASGMLTGSGTFTFGEDYVLLNHLFAVTGTSGGSLELTEQSDPHILIVQEGKTLDVTSSTQFGLDKIYGIINNGTINVDIAGDNPDTLVLNGFTGLSSSAMLNLGTNANQVVELQRGAYIEQGGLATYFGSISGAGQLVQNDNFTTKVVGSVNIGSLGVSQGTFEMATTAGLTNNITGDVSVSNGATLALSGAGVTTNAGSLTTADGSNITLSNGAILSTAGNTVMNATVSGVGTLMQSSGQFSLGTGSIGDNTTLALGDTASWALNQNASVGAISGSGTVNLNGNQLAVNNAGGTFNGTFTGAGTLVKSGEGIQTLVGSGNADMDIVLSATKSDAGLCLTNVGNIQASYGDVSVNSGTLYVKNIPAVTRSTNATNVKLNSLAMGAGTTLNVTFAGNTESDTKNVPITTVNGTNLNGTQLVVTCVNPNSFNSYNSSGFQFTLIHDESDQMSVTDSSLSMGFLNSMFEWEMFVKDGDLIVKGTGREGNYYDQAALTHNSQAVANLLYNATETIINSPDSELKYLADAVANQIAAGNLQEASRTMAAAGGSTITSLSVAQRDGFRDQLTWIRNRTVGMGVNQSVENDDMPYYHMWVQGTGGYNDLKTAGDESGYSLSYWGATAGVDIDLTENWTTGAAFTANFGDLDANAADTASGTIDSYYVSLFARMQKRVWAHTFVVTGGWNDAKLNRTVDYGTGSYNADGSTSGSGFGAMYELTYDYYLNEDHDSLLQPLFNISVVSTKMDGYEETGAGNAGLKVNDQKMTTTTVALGGRWLGLFGNNLFGRESLGELRLNVAQDMGDDRGVAGVGFLGNPGFTQNIQGAKLGSTALQIGGSVTVPLGQESNIFVEANADFRNKQNSVNGSIGYRYNF